MYKNIYSSFSSGFVSSLTSATFSFSMSTFGDFVILGDFLGDTDLCTFSGSSVVSEISDF